MEFLEIRPRFQFTIPHVSERVLDRIKQLLDDSPSSISGNMIDNHVILDIIEDVHYWTPQLNFRVERSEEDPSQSVVSGLIGPRPSTWTLFMFFYFSIGVIGFFICSFGVAKILMGEYSNYILAFPITVLIMLTAYKAGKHGEKLAENQTEILRQF